jgi:hypothetical protein
MMAKRTALGSVRVSLRAELGKDCGRLIEFVDGASAVAERPLSHGVETSEARSERVGVRGYALSFVLNSSPGSQERSDLSLRER